MLLAEHVSEAWSGKKSRSTLPSTYFCNRRSVPAPRPPNPRLRDWFLFRIPVAGLSKKFKVGSSLKVERKANSKKWTEE